MPTAIITITSEVVTKELKDPTAIRMGTFEREIMWLHIMREWDRTPNLLDIDPLKKIITMSYCGECAKKENLPGDWEAQRSEILAGLNKYCCCHNDITTGEILVLNGKLQLVDFGWATAVGEPIPEYWPKGLGIGNTLGVHKFDDGHAFSKTIGDIS